MIAHQHTDHEPVQGLALRRSLAEILARPVVSLPTPEQTLGSEARAANGRASAARMVQKHQKLRAGGRPPFDRRAVGDDLARGMSLLDVTDKYKISDTTAKKILKERGIKRQARGSAPRFDHEQALRDLDSGLSTREVAALHKVHPQTVNRVRRDRRAQG